ncbi:hypothetical protein RB195_003169 [Necator americanus]|uniref:Uncharacterized protein n=1 Tax=Necator americanus TaxID=51031 RepID=A0ABR1DMC0_NECAM
MERLDCKKKKLRRLDGYLATFGLEYATIKICAKIDVVYWRMTRRRHQHPAPPSKVVTRNRLRFFGHILKRPADRLV